MTEPTQVTCPSCSGTVPVATKAARTASCPYCQSTLIVNEAAIRVLGKMALLAETPSCLAVGWRARCLDREIMVLGRLQFRYQAGLWDEWWVRFEDDGSYAWISQDEDEYVLERPVAEARVPDYDSVRPGDRVAVGKSPFWVEEKDEAVMVGMQGELPREAAPENVMRYLELTNNKHHVTVEYFEDGPPEVFVGRRLHRKDLEALDAPPGAAAFGVPYSRPQMSRPAELAGPLAQGDEAAGEVIPSSKTLRPQSVTCTSCGGTVELRDAKGTAMVVCQYCGSGLDVSVPGTAKLLYEAEEKAEASVIPLGSKGRFKGAEWTVVGRVRYREDDFSGYWIWDEWQLHSPQKGYAFLALENGHWVFFEPLDYRVRIDPRTAQPKQPFSLHGQRFQVFERSRAVITYVEGELSWVARLGDKLGYMDAIRPPQMVSAEWTENELEWTVGRYVSRSEVAKAFELKTKQLPRPSGVAPAQPFERTKGQRIRAWSGLAVALFLVVMLVYSLIGGSGRQILDTGNIPSQQYLSDSGYVSEPVEVAEGSHICQLRAVSNQVNNSWVSLSIAVLDENEKVVLDADQTVEYYHGVQGGESWSEGSRKDSKLMRLEGPQTYRLNVFGECGTWSRIGGNRKTSRGPPVRLQLYREVLPSRYFLIGMILAVLYPIWEFGRQALFEARRWPSEEDD